MTAAENDSQLDHPSLRLAGDLLGGIGRPVDAALNARLEISGVDPVLATRFRVGEAVTAALVAVGVASDDLWRLRGGTPQRISIDLRAAAASLLSFLFQRAPKVSLERMAPPTVGLYRARHGGWIHLHGGFPHLHDGTLNLLGCADDATAIAHAVAEHDAQDLEDTLATRGLCGARLRSAVEWSAHAQGRVLAQTPLVELIRIGDADPTPLPGPRAQATGARPLSGLRVLDLTRVLAGPTCARTLAEHGAEVLHVRSPRLPAIEPFVIDTNPGKRSCYLDLDQAADSARLRELTRGADVFSQGYRAGTLERRGFGPQALAELRPGIIAVAINCYGHEGPWAARPGWEQLAQTVTGIAHEHGGTEAAAIIPGAVTDYTTGYLAALGVLRALERRAREGGSWQVRVSLARTAMWIQSLPRVAADAEPSGIDLSVVQQHQIEMDTAWGRLVRLGPLLRMSETPPHWHLPPVPLGHHPPSWA